MTKNEKPNTRLLSDLIKYVKIVKEKRTEIAEKLNEYAGIETYSGSHYLQAAHEKAYYGRHYTQLNWYIIYLETKWNAAVLDYYKQKYSETFEKLRISEANLARCLGTTPLPYQEMDDLPPAYSSDSQPIAHPYEREMWLDDEEGIDFKPPIFHHEKE